MAVVPLLDVAGPPLTLPPTLVLDVAVTINKIDNWAGRRLPSRKPLWWCQSEMLPSVAFTWMFKNAAKTFKRGECRCEASAIVAKFELMRLARAAVPEAAPPLTWRVRDNRIRP